jgi:hypothetical protein
MVTRSTRLEFLIVTIAFVVLLLCSRPPRSGNAEITEPIEPVAQSLPAVAKPAPLPGAKPVAQAVQPVRAPSIRQTATPPVDMTGLERSSTSKIATKRMATVDARNCPGLNYREVMYGEVTARLVWDGNRFFARKVCIVKEPDGTTSVWSFDDPGNAILTEIGEVPVDGQ